MPNTYQCALYLQVKRVSSVQFAQEPERYACVVVQLQPAALLPLVLALWRGPPTCAGPQCLAGAARPQCLNDQPLRKGTKNTTVLVDCQIFSYNFC